MAERASLLGGTVQHGPASGAYQVDVRIPLPAAVPP